MAKRKRTTKRKAAAPRKRAAAPRKAPKKRRRRGTKVREAVDTQSRVVQHGWNRTTITYQLERVTCGTERCSGCPHGPYWYAYFSDGRGRKKSKYIGKRFRPLTAEEVFDDAA